MTYPKRVIFAKGEQRKFLELIKNRLSLNSSELANLAGIHIRTLVDWKREKYSVSLPALKRLCRKAKISLPKNIKIKDPFWYVSNGSSAGAIAVYKKYGHIGGDPEYRKKKWREWWEREGRYKKHPIIGVSKPIKKPCFSKKLAEFVGIMMGDGNINRYQVKVSINSKDDKDYEYFIKDLIEKLFHVPVSMYYHKDSLEISLVVSRTRLVEFCNKKLGLKIGNKLKQGLDMPEWIKSNIEFQKSCLRGLMDTDGCIFYERHKIKNKIYSYKRLNFTSYSPELRKSVFSIFEKLNMLPKIRNNRSVQVENKEQINRYFEIIGTHNPKHKRRFLEGYG